jgi:hypothetical protein
MSGERIMGNAIRIACDMADLGAKYVESERSLRAVSEARVELDRLLACHRACVEVLRQDHCITSQGEPFYCECPCCVAARACEVEP